MGSPVRGGEVSTTVVGKKGKKERKTHSDEVHLFHPPRLSPLEDLPEHIKAQENGDVDICFPRTCHQSATIPAYIRQ